VPCVTSSNRMCAVVAAHASDSHAHQLTLVDTCCQGNRVNSVTKCESFGSRERPKHQTLYTPRLDSRVAGELLRRCALGFHLGCVHRSTHCAHVHEGPGRRRGGQQLQPNATSPGKDISPAPRPELWRQSGISEVR